MASMGPEIGKIWSIKSSQERQSLYRGIYACERPYYVLTVVWAGVCCVDSIVYAYVFLSLCSCHSGHVTGVRCESLFRL